MTMIKRCIHDVLAMAFAIAIFPGGTHSQAPSNMTPLAGVIQSVTDTTLTVQTDKAVVSVHLIKPFTVYASSPSDLAHVKANSFVGITSVKQPDGTELASEIHIIAEELRGIGEGSYMMNTADKTGKPNRMTNGAVSDSRMTNGSVESSKKGSSLTIKFKAGEQTIMIPPGVPVTMIARTNQRLSPGARAFILSTKQDDGTYSASKALLRDPASPR